VEGLLLERDLPAELAVVDSEEQAYEFVFELFCKWIGLRLD
jgi:hypothetical protein